MVPGLGRGAPGTAGAGRPMPVPVPNGLLPGRGPAGRPMPVPVPNGLLPGRGPAGRGARTRGVVGEGRPAPRAAAGAVGRARPAPAGARVRRGSRGRHDGRLGHGDGRLGRRGGSGWRRCVGRGRCRLAGAAAFLAGAFAAGAGRARPSRAWPPACAGPRAARWSRTPTSRTHRAPAAWRGLPCWCTRAPWRARGPEPSTQLSCLGPGGVRRTVSASDTRSCSRAHGVFILELPIRSSGDGHRSAAARAVAHAGPCCLGPMARGSSVRLPIAARSGARSRGPATRRARGSARRRSARSRHCWAGWRCAPRPGSRRSGSGTQAPATTTTRNRSDAAARCRHPTHVRSDTRRDPGVLPARRVYPAGHPAQSAAGACRSGRPPPGGRPPGRSPPRRAPPARCRSGCRSASR